MAVTERRKGWIEKTKRQLRGPRRRPDAHQTQYHAAIAEAATTDEVGANRHAMAQPSQRATAQERRDQYVERWIFPWAYSVCLKIVTIRNARDFPDNVDLLTARAECNPYMEDEIAYLEALADDLFSNLPCENAFTVVRQRLEVLNAYEPGTDRNSDEYIAAELRLFMLTGAWGLELSGGDLYSLVEEIEGDLTAFENALRKPMT
jgi:hypothetical protein